MVRSAAQLIRRQGVAATGMREVVMDAGAPRGSLQHYFPGGKEQLVSEALTWMGSVASSRVRRHQEELGPAPPSRLLAVLVDEWRRDLSSEAFSAGCPLVAAAADGATTGDELREVLREAFTGWQEPLTAALTERGIHPERAAPLAMVTISALEGAIILSRVRHDLIPLDVVVAELGPVLDAAAARSRKGRPA
jgi:AcrR family transcriptional regulator